MQIERFAILTLILPHRYHIITSSIVPVLPFPPLEQFRIGIFGGGIVDSATEDIEKAGIDTGLLDLAHLLVHTLRVLLAEVVDGADVELPEILGNALPDAGDFAEVAKYFGFGVGHGFFLPIG